jgi:carboxyl-terminal processing protease
LRKFSFYHTAKNVFSGIGVLVTVVLLVVLLTNATGISTLVSALYFIQSDSLYVDRLDRQKAFQGALAGVVGTLDDPYSEYLDHGQWKSILSRLNAEMGGIGVYFLQQADASMRVVEPIAGGPADRAGLQDGDVLTEVDGAAVIGLDQDYVLSLVRGEPGTKVNVTVYRDSDASSHSFDLVREIISIPSVQREVMDYRQTQIGYIYLNQFHSRSAEEIADALRELSAQGASSLILDVRNNGGGDFEAALMIADLFLEEGIMVNIVDAQGNTEQRLANLGSSPLPMVMLVNGNSASASEVLAGALQDNGRAILLGDKTFGKGLVQTIYPLVDGGALKITTRKYLTPLETDINDVGIVPDVEVSNTGRNQDIQLQRAMDILTGNLRE